jgi:hypothetical protein
MADDPKQPKDLNIGMTELHSAISALNDKLDKIARPQCYECSCGPCIGPCVVSYCQPCHPPCYQCSYCVQCYHCVACQPQCVLCVQNCVQCTPQCVLCVQNCVQCARCVACTNCAQCTNCTPCAGA